MAGGSLFEDAGFDVPKKKPAEVEKPTTKEPVKASGSIFKDAGFDIPGRTPTLAPASGKQFSDEIPIHAPGTPEFAEEQRKYPPNRPELKDTFENRINALRSDFDLGNVAQGRMEALPQHFKEAFNAASKEYSTGRENFRQTPWTGAGQMALGGLGMIGAPIGSAMQTLVGDPVTQWTGNPEIGQRASDVAGFFLPTRATKGAAKVYTQNNALNEIVKSVGPENALEAAQRMSRNPELSLMDVSDQARVRAQGLAADPEQPIASNILTQEVRRRQAEAPAATNEAYTQAFGQTPNVPALLDQLKQHAIDVGKQQIEPAIAGAKPVNTSGVIAAIDRDLKPGMTAFMDPSTRLPLSKYQEELVRIKQQLINPETGETLTDAGRLHQIQSDLRAKAHNMMTSATGSERPVGKQLSEVRNNIVGAIDEASGGKYKPGLASYRDAKQIDEAFDAGFDTLKNRPGREGLEDRPEMFAEWMKNAPQSERIARQLGTRLDIDQKINAVRDQARAGQNITAIPYNRAKLEMLFGKDEAGRLINAMEDARAKAETNTKIIGGSKTAETLAGQKAMAVRKVGGGNPLSVLSPLAAEAAGIYMGAPGLGTAAYVGAKTAKLGAQALGAALDRQKNIAFAKAISATGPERDQIIRSMLSHPRVVREMKKSGNALTSPFNP